MRGEADDATGQWWNPRHRPVTRARPPEARVMPLLVPSLLYAYFMILSFLLIEPRFYENKSRRPDLLRATWIAAALLPITPITPLTVVILPLAILLAKKGARVAAAIVSLIPLFYATIALLSR